MTQIERPLFELSEARIFNSYLSYIHAQNYTGLDANMTDRNMSIEEKEISDLYNKACEEYYNLKHKVIKI